VPIFPRSGIPSPVDEQKDVSLSLIPSMQPNAAPAQDIYQILEDAAASIQAEHERRDHNAQPEDVLPEAGGFLVPPDKTHSSPSTTENINAAALSETPEAVVKPIFMTTAKATQLANESAMANGEALDTFAARFALPPSDAEDEFSDDEFSDDENIFEGTSSPTPTRGGVNNQRPISHALSNRKRRVTPDDDAIRDDDCVDDVAEPSPSKRQSMGNISEL
jgi:hypothetical protein